jgi:hypothetical protein
VVLVEARKSGFIVSWTYAVHPKVATALEGKRRAEQGDKRAQCYPEKISPPFFAAEHADNSADLKRLPQELSAYLQIRVHPREFAASFC